MIDYKILQSDWLRTFWSIFQEQKFTQKWDLCKNTARNINFRYRSNSVKIKKIFSNKLKKPCFWSILDRFFQFLGQKKSFLENSALSRTTLYGFLAPCENLEKVNDAIQRKRPDRKKDGRMERPYSIGPLWLLPGIQ